MIKHGRWIAALFLCGTVLGGLYVNRAALLPRLASWLDVGVPPQRGEYAMVLPGDENCRPFLAGALVQAGWADRVLVPESASPPLAKDGVIPPASEIIRRVLRYQGVPEEDIVFAAGQGGGTMGDMRALASFLASKPEARVIVVTTDYHTRRARWALAHIPNAPIHRVSFVSAPTDAFQPKNWWQADTGFMAVTGEYLKLAYYVLRYSKLPYWMAAVGLLLGTLLAVKRVWARRHASKSSQPC